MSEYKFIGTVSADWYVDENNFGCDTTFLYECMGCGAAVVDTQLHDEFHATLEGEDDGRPTR